MKESTKLKQQALMLKAAFEEGFKAAGAYARPDKALPPWEESTAKVMHDQLLLEANGGLDVKTNLGNS